MRIPVRQGWIHDWIASPLQIAILSLFIELKTRFPNMITGTLTRDKIRESMDKGITADQIIEYLETHAHPVMKQEQPILPMTVVDQLRLWEMERHRLKVMDGYLYQQFNRLEEYVEVSQYAKDVGCLLWSNEKKRMLVVTAAGHHHVRQFVKRKLTANQ
jgi:transcription initiation factor TFIIH subunit 4